MEKEREKKKVSHGQTNSCSSHQAQYFSSNIQHSLVALHLHHRLFANLITEKRYRMLLLLLSVQ